MERMQLLVNSRKASNKGAARALRRSGNIPAILYGEGTPQPISVDAKEWATRFRSVTSNTILVLKHGKEEHNVLVKDVQDDILSGQVSHIDFYAIHANQKLQTQVPIHLEGTPIGVREGGILEHKIEELEVVCLPRDIPSHFTVDISHLNVGDSLHVGEVSSPEGVEIRTEEKLTVVVITHAKAEVAEVEDEDAVLGGEGTEQDGEA